MRSLQPICSRRQFVAETDKYAIAALTQAFCLRQTWNPRRTNRHTVGGGWKYVFAGQWTARVRYNYINFGNKHHNISSGAAPDFKNDFHIVKAEISYELNGV